MLESRVSELLKIEQPKCESEEIGSIDLCSSHLISLILGN